MRPEERTAMSGKMRGPFGRARPAVEESRSTARFADSRCVFAARFLALAALLRENSRTRNSFVMFSEDEGRTWSEPRELPGASFFQIGARHKF